MELQNKILEYCRTQALIHPGDRVVCAVSGGRDSMALLWSLYLLREKLQLQLSAAHFNHGLRGEESLRDQNFVEAFCERYEIPLTVGTGTVQNRGRGLEDAARKARYGFFETLDGKIATAHTAEDNAETVLLHLLRGSGLRGLGGIAPNRGPYIRPMLTCTHGEAEAFLAEWQIPYVEDSTNAEGQFLRNRIRQEVLPVLCRENPKFPVHCSAAAGTLREDQDLLEQLAGEAYENLREASGLSCAGLLSLPPALRRRVLERFLQESGVVEPEAVHLREAEALAASENPSAKKRFPGNVLISRRYGHLCRELLPEKLPDSVLTLPGQVQMGPWEITAALEIRRNANTPYTFYLSCDKIGKNPLQLRTRQPGDRLRLSGGEKTLKKLCIDRKIPALHRDTLPVFCRDGQIVAVAGIGPHVDFEAKPEEPAWIIRIMKKKEVICHVGRCN